ncbi:unnamed protein product [Sphenostylis stenocarpa]|uniref:Uncharacterized protein n=1 Tax=Sphenostylis stenocarpa TaxID=92480 RepID=A0AA86T9T4_9FABA|nr:unnamed protein product [Sphenostylis stenocarpa]
MTKHNSWKTFVIYSSHSDANFKRKLRPAAKWWDPQRQPVTFVLPIKGPNS